MFDGALLALFIFNNIHISIGQSAKDQTDRNCKIHGKIEVIHAKVQSWT